MVVKPVVVTISWPSVVMTAVRASVVMGMPLWPAPPPEMVVVPVAVVIMEPSLVMVATKVEVMAVTLEAGRVGVAITEPEDVPVAEPVSAATLEAPALPRAAAQYWEPYSMARLAASASLAHTAKEQSLIP